MKSQSEKSIKSPCFFIIELTSRRFENHPTAAKTRKSDVMAAVTVTAAAAMTPFESTKPPDLWLS